jgi:hypothetical protein
LCCEVSVKGGLIRSEVILNMLRTLIRDLDFGKDLHDAGWLPLKEEDVRNLQQFSFCEVDYENMRGRINPLSKLPEDLLLTNEGLIFSDYIKSVDVIKEVYRRCEDVKQYHNIIASGLKFMFQKANYVFWEKEGGSVPDEIRSLILSPQWVRASEKFANLLTQSLLTTIIDGTIGEDRLTTTQEENNEILKIFNAIKTQWMSIVKYFSEHPELIEFLGLIWFTFKRVEENRVEYLGARIFVFNEVAKMVANKKGIGKDLLHKKLEEMSEDLDKLIEKEQWGVSWSDIFTIPW